MTDLHGDLVADLRALGDRLDVGEGAASPDPATVALRRITSVAASDGASAARARPPTRPRGPLRRPALVAAALIVALLVAVAIPGSRAALARLLGIGAVRIVTSADAPPPLDAPYDLGEAIDVEQAVARAPAPLVPAGLGPPDAAFVGRPDGAATVVWRTGPALPPIDGSDGATGLIVTAIPGPIDVPLVTKEVGPSGEVVSTTVSGRPARWISGPPHVVRNEDGGDGSDPMRLAGNTLLWTDGVVTYRLESALELDAAVALAERLPRGAPPG
jgi:hypothetical protein